ncbi:hypothetical protein Vse01_50250 [Micromonospora sediminimaris]|uniref:Lipoprotein n=1 Tax=Micromonospora sediminimaris TaxID=547162 RepID=A0A9W5UVL1_9ACTN|nr:hypothetical protein Vse01_50250 [Micromonospora sediminimaris]
MLRIDVVAAGLLLALTGCTGGPRTPTSTEKAPGISPGQAPEPAPAPAVGSGRVLDGDGYRTLVAGATYDFLAAMHGRVAVGDGGCLTLRDEAGAAVVVWPPGTTLLPNGRVGVRVPDVGEIVVGDRVDGGGGFFEAPLTEAGLPEHLPPIPAACASVGAALAVLERVSRYSDS